MSRLEAIVNSSRQKRERQEKQYAEEKARQETEFLAAQHDRNHFFSAINAIPTPMHIYALWLLVYVENGGSITHPRNRNFTDTQSQTITHDGKWQNHTRFFMPSPNGPASTEVALSADVAASKKDRIKIPTGYGASSFELLVFPDLSPDISLHPTSGDRRTGWEWGHTTVMTLSVKKNRRSLMGSVHDWVATTNNPGVVESFLDVEALLLDERECKKALSSLRKRMLNFNPSHTSSSNEQREIR